MTTRTDWQPSPELANEISKRAKWWCWNDRDLYDDLVQQAYLRILQDELMDASVGLQITAGWRAMSVYRRSGRSIDRLDRWKRPTPTFRVALEDIEDLMPGRLAEEPEPYTLSKVTCEELSCLYSERQADVMELRLAGYKNHEIAAKLGIAEGTVEKEVSRVRRKTAAVLAAKVD